MQHLQRLFL